jgi:hypothetical protein
MAMFALRFDRMGSLYLSSTSESNVVVGPIVSLPFYRALDGCVPYASELFRLRGPFSNTSPFQIPPITFRASYVPNSISFHTTTLSHYLNLM